MDTVLKCPWCYKQIQKMIGMFGRCPHCAGCVMKVRGNLRRDGVFVQGTDNWAGKKKQKGN